MASGVVFENFTAVHAAAAIAAVIFFGISYAQQTDPQN